MKKPAVSIFHNTYSARKDGGSPVAIRVAFRGARRLFPTGVVLTPADFDAAMGGSRKANHREAHRVIYAEFARINEIIDGLPVFSFPALDRAMTDPSADKRDRTLRTLFKRRVEELNAEGRVGTAVAVRVAGNSLEAYRSGATLEDVDRRFLEGYERWMLDRGRALTTVGINLRTLRSIYRAAIDNGIARMDDYPFGVRRYVIPSPTRRKVALTPEEIRQLYAFQPEPGSREERAKDYWFFMFSVNGINPKDVALLRYKNIEGDFIVLTRAKTSRTKRTGEQIRAYIDDDVRAIIDRQGRKPVGPDKYIFPILEDGMTPAAVHQEIQYFVKMINAGMQAIGKRVGIEKRITCNVARASHITTLFYAGVPADIIRKVSTTHASQAALEHYIASAVDDKRIEVHRMLNSWKENSKPPKPQSDEV